MASPLTRGIAYDHCTRVTHDQEEALEVADRVVVMNQAKVEQVGTPAEVFHHPASEFVMDFLGNVNVFRGRVEHGKAVWGNVSVELPSSAPQRASQANLYVRPMNSRSRDT